MQKKNAYTPMALSGILVVAACLSASLGLAGCQKEGGAEEAGRKIDQTAKQMGNQLEVTKESMDKKADRAGDYLEDAAITARIKTEILAESLLKVFQIDVTTTNGVVTLSGTNVSYGSEFTVRSGTLRPGLSNGLGGASARPPPRRMPKISCGK